MSNQGKRLQDRIALVTGASRGIGAAIAERFAAEGAHVVLVARTVGGLEEVDDAIRKNGDTPATLVPLDIKEFDKIDQLGASLYERFGKLDVLVANAALLGALSPVGHIQPATWNDVIDVNLTASWRMIRSFDPLLRLSDAGRAIFVTSAIVGADRPFWGAYAASKAALETLVKTYAAEVERLNVKANLLDPGRVRTSMRAQAYPGEDPETLPLPSAITDAFVELAEAGCKRNGEILRAY